VKADEMNVAATGYLQHAHCAALRGDAARLPRHLYSAIALHRRINSEQDIAAISKQKAAAS